MMEPQGDEVFAYEPQSGYADPYSVTTGYARRAREMGARVLTESPATGIEVIGGRVTAVLTQDGRIETPIAVVATGPWSRAFPRRRRRQRTPGHGAPPGDHAASSPGRRSRAPDHGRRGERLLGQAGTRAT